MNELNKQTIEAMDKLFPYIVSEDPRIRIITIDEDNVIELSKELDLDPIHCLDAFIWIWSLGPVYSLLESDTKNYGSREKFISKINKIRCEKFINDGGWKNQFKNDRIKEKPKLWSKVWGSIKQWWWALIVPIIVSIIAYYLIEYAKNRP